MNTHKTRLDKLTAAVVAAGQTEYDTIPTRYLFGVERHQAAANYDGASPDVVAERVASVSELINAVDRERTRHGTDLVGAAMLKHAMTPGLPYTPDAVAASVVEAAWRFDAEHVGESHAWKNQRNRDAVAITVKGRMASDDRSRVVGDLQEKAWLKTLTVEELEIGAAVIEHVERTGSTDGLDPHMVAQYNALMERWQEWKGATHEG